MMSQFGKNPPWARDVGSISQSAGMALNQSQIGLVSQMYGQSAVPAPTVFSLQPGIALPTSLASSHVATISYPAPRPTSSSIQQKQRVFTGAVTKLHENFGFVDEDVFFQTSCVKGQQPKFGDRVLVEATYNASMPFKWNATRIQVLPTNVQAINSPQTSQAYQAMVAQSSFHTVAPASQSSGTAYHFKSSATGSSAIPSLAQPPPPPLMSKQTQPVQGRGMNLGQGSRRSEASGFRERGDRQRERGASRERRERRSPRKRSRSPIRRSRSPLRRSHSPRSPSAKTKSPVRQRRVARPASRYTVQIPKISLDLKEANLMTLRSRYGNMYIPSDFFSSTFLWVEAFPAHRPFVLGQSCDFHVLPKSTETPIKSETATDPSDADYRFSAKVMLLSCPTLDDIFHKSCALAEDTSEVRDSFQHPTRLIQFLVGLKGKSEPMAIGGPWSPSLDGPNPNDDPRCLINTAIRTTKLLTGIDLSHCTQWFRFAEVRYFRPEEVRKGRTVPAHVETVVIFLPDVWTCRPTSLEWQTLAAEYRTQLEAKLSTEEFKTKEEEVEVEKEAVEDKKDPTHHSDLDPKTMKLNDLRQELECRSLSSKGLKSQLIARLTKALRSEEEKEAEETENRCAEEDENREEEEGGRMDGDEKEENNKKTEEEEKLRAREKERANLIRQYTLPDTPSILVHPSTTAKGGKFECSVMSLSLLLDYRPEDNKEHVFEVSLFAEMFNEMLMRDFGFRIYKLLVSSPEAAEEEKKDKPKDEDKKDKARNKDDEKKAKDFEEVKKEGSDAEKGDGRKSSKKTQAALKKDEKQEAEERDIVDEESTKDKKTVVKDEDADDKSGVTVPEDERPSVEAVKMEVDEPVSTTTLEQPVASSSPEKNPKHPHLSVEGKSADADVKAEEDQSRVDDDHHEDGKDGKDKKSSRSLVKHDRSRFYTAEPELLLAFIYFDQSHAGYLVDKDVEEILYTLGLQLSRAQVKKLVAKLASRDMLNYRRLTDVMADKEVEDKGSSAPLLSHAGDQMDDGTLALGNRRFLHAAETDVDLTRGVPRKRAHLEDAADGEAGAVSSDGVVMHNGAFVDINSIMQNLNKSEKSRVSMEARLKELQQDLDNVRTTFGSTESANQTMSSEIQELKKKLHDQRRSLDQSESHAKKYYDLLMRADASMSALSGEIKEVCDKVIKAKTE